MVDSGALFPAGGPDPGGPARPRRPRHPPGRGGRRAANPPQIDIVGATSPIEERPADFPNAPAVYSTGLGGAEMYHYDRQPTYRDQHAAELAQVTGPGQP